MPREVHSVAESLVSQSRDAALSGIQVFNNPMVTFKSETYIVLMNIAWMYLLHAYYRRNKVEYRYFRLAGTRRRFDRTRNGSFKYWDLAKCLTVDECPLDNETKKNLTFLIGLRDEVTHHMSPLVDQYVSARYQACCLNYNRYVKELFGERYAIDKQMTYSLQLQGLSRAQLAAHTEADLPAAVRSYIAKFDDDLSVDEMNSERFAYRVLFVPRLVGKPGQADEMVEFVKSDSDVAKSANIDYVALKEVERPKFLPGEIARMMRDEGFVRFSISRHTDLWKAMDAKNPAKGYGVSIANAWYWYSRWVDAVRQHCMANPQSYQ